MTMLAVERIKLFSTRSVYWCLAVILAAALLFALMMSTISVNGEQVTSTALSQTGIQIGMMVFMVLATLAVTTEYRFGTIRPTFLAEPHRTRVLLAKTVVLAALGAVTAAVCSFAAFFLTKVLADNPQSPVELATATDWRLVLGNAALFPIAAIFAVAIGALIRQSAGAIALLLVWAMLVEGLVTLIPRVGDDIQPWLPFTAGGRFVTDPGAFAAFEGGAGGPAPAALGTSGPTPVEGLFVFLGYAVLLWIVAAITLHRRDA